jgi:hypothetical protein
MTSDDKKFLKEFICGASFAICLAGIFVLFIALMGTLGSSQDGVESPKFKVMNQYKNCDVVRYIDPSNRYNYLLDCTKE